jgi:hypothetical protein
LRINEAFLQIQKEFIKQSTGKVIIQVLFPSFVLYVQQKFMNREAVEKQLFHGGEILAEIYLKYGDIFHLAQLTKKYGSILHEKAILKFYQEMLHNKKVNLRKIDENTYHLEDSTCILCGDIEIEELNVHLCTSISGFLSRILNEFSHQKFKVQTIASKWMQSPICIHEIKIITEGK